MHRRRGWLPVLALFGAISGVLAWHAHISARCAALNERLFQAVNAGDARAVEDLLRRGANPNARVSKLEDLWRNERALLLDPAHWHELTWDWRVGRLGGSPPLEWARDAATVRVLLAHGADPNREGCLHSAPLSAQAGWGNAAMVRALLAAGADVHQRDWHGWTALHCAISGLQWPPPPRSVADHHYADVLHALIAAGADVNARTDQGKTALAMARERGNPRYVRLLLEAGARTSGLQHLPNGLVTPRRRPASGTASRPPGG